MATGLSYLRDGEYVDSVEEVDPVAGGAQAVQGRHQVQWSLNGNNPNGAVTLTTPDGKTLTSTVFGLAYYDVASGSNAAIARLQSCNGSIVAPNQVLYANAFSGVNADVQYTYRKAGLSQDIVLRQSPPAPDRYGLADETAVLQVYTQFFNPAQPELAAVTNGNIVDEPILDFGAMQMGVGQAFFLKGQAAPVSAGMVSKQWVQINGSTFLIEAIPYSAISNQLQQLPQASNLKPGRGSIRRMVLMESNPSRPNGSAKGGRPMKVARAETTQPRLMVDYDILSGSTNNYTFQADTTYYLSGTVNASGTVTFEGGAVLKYTNNACLNINAPAQVNCLGTIYRPTVFTAKDDDSVGQPIPGSWGTPQGLYANPAIAFNGGADGITAALKHFRISNASEAIYASGIYFIVQLSDGQIIECPYGIYASAGYFEPGTPNVTLENMLFSGSCSVADLTLGIAYVTAENVTFDGGASLVVPQQSGQTSNTYAYFTNCIIADTGAFSPVMANPVSGDHNGFYNSGWNGGSGATFGTSPITNATNPFQTVGAGNYYLANGCAFTNAGTTSIDTNLLADLQSLTTYPPTNNYINVTITNNLTLSPQVPRDTNGSSVDLGYHYDPIDYAVSMIVSNASVTVSNGTVLAACGPEYGVLLTNNAVFTCNGTATSPNYMVRYNTVQESWDCEWASTNWQASFITTNGGGVSAANFRFTGWSVLAQDGQFSALYQDGPPIGFQDCQFFGGTITAPGQTLLSTNCLYQRVNMTINDYGINGVSNSFYNNLFLEGELTFRHSTGGSSGIWTFRDNLFDRTWITNLSNSTIDICSNNACVTTNFGVLVPTNSYVILTNSPAYESGSLGDYYYPTNLTSLIHKGSRSATNVGLYHYTVTTNNAIEGTNTVSIGFHYVATDADGVPLDSNGEGLPDYVEDSNGDGVYDKGDLFNWLSPFNIYDQGVSYGGYYPENVRLGYWRFNSSLMTNEAGYSPVVNVVQTNGDWSGTAMVIGTNHNQRLTYNWIEPTSGWQEFNQTNGTVRFWWCPAWTSTNMGGVGPPPDTPRIIQYGDGTTIDWELFVDSPTGDLQFQCISNGIWQEQYIFAPWDVVSNHWMQIALTYSPTNIAVYTNGVLLATGNGIPKTVSGNTNNFDAAGGMAVYPPYVSGATFSIGTDDDNVNSYNPGEYDELETFNYPLTAQQVAAGYPNFGGNTTNMLDTYYVGRSDMLQTYVDGFSSPASTNLVPCRLGYWRFDSPLLYAEQGQLPLSINDISLAPSWSGTALNINSHSASQITYPDVGSNGWANVNCRQGSLRFWFKPNGSGGTGHSSPFVYMGTANASDEWGLWLNGGHTSISFITASNNAATTNFTASCSLSTTNWTQIVLTYGSNASSLYINGTPVVTNGSPVTYWPRLSNRNLGMVIGNSTAYNVSINGQFDEMETFNYILDVTNIAWSFNAVKSVDSDLDGVADLLEEISLPTNVPFMGAPFPVTGVFEAEQFDQGGENIGYHTLDAVNATTNYRVSKLCVTNCDDVGGGYCVDKLRTNEWLQYSMDVRVGQTYAVEARVEGVGSNGVFKIEFFTNGTLSGWTTNNLTVPGTNWANVTFKNLWLPAATNVMRVTLLTNGLVNGAGSGYVMKFNYTSIYPSWNEGVSNIVITNVVSGLISNLFDWVTASNNAVAIQASIDQLNSLNPTNGGIVSIPSGTYYVASQEITVETNGEAYNTALFIYRNNVQIQGAGQTNTVLVAHNRAVTPIYVGSTPNPFTSTAVTNFTLTGLTLEGSPHWVYDPTNTNQRHWEDGGFNPTPYGGYNNTGCLFVASGFSASGIIYPLCNLLITNCLFQNGSCDAITLVGYVNNFLSRSNDIIFWADGTNGTFNGNITDPTCPTTTNYQVSDVGIFVRAGGPSLNLNVLECYYNGNVTLTNISQAHGGDGIIWFQWLGGNWFAARNCISNNHLEAIQWNSGPAAAVQNTFFTYESTGSVCALNNTLNSSVAGPTGQIADVSFSFVGNSVTGGRQGVDSVGSGSEPSDPSIAHLLVSGNDFNLYPPYSGFSDGIGGAANLWNVSQLNLSGNTLLSGGDGLIVQGTCSNAVILKNDFSAAAHLGIDDEGPGGSLLYSEIVKNQLSCGVSFHLRAPLQDGTHYFLLENSYLNTNGSAMTLFPDPLNLPFHFNP